MSVTPLHRWRMSLGMTLPLAVLIVALLLALSLSARPSAAAHPTTRTLAPLTSQLTQISSDPFTNTTSNHKTEVEPDTFGFGNTIVAAFQQGRFFNGGASDIGFATSTDGGKHWIHGSLPSATVNSTPPGPYARASDASVAFDARHKVWIISWLGIINPAGPVDVVASRSTDGGKTWGAPVVINASGDFNDKNWSVCDDSPQSRFYGNCYTEFDDATLLNRFSMSTSTDGGKTWGAAKSDPDNTCVIGGQPLVQPNGTVIVPIDDCFEATLLSIRSTDGGKTWSRPFFVNQVLNDGHPGGIRSPDLPSAEMDKSGRVYVVWTDCRLENLCNDGTNDLLFSTSDDGMNWSVAKRIPAFALGSGFDALIPGLAVDRGTSGNDAHLGLVYYYFPSINCDPTTCQLDVGFISSTNGGNTWSAPAQLAGPMTLTWLPLTTQGFMVADYLSTSILNHADYGSPVFEVANAPTPPPNCSDLNTGNPGQGCDQATNTELEAIVGGNNAASDTTSTAAAPVSKGASKKRVVLTAPATDD